MQKRKGFTLIELLVVISIISLLSSTVFATLNSGRQKARDARRVTEISQIKKAFEFYADNNAELYPPIPTSNCGEWVLSNSGCWGKLGIVLQQWMAVLPIDPLNTTVGGTPYIYAYQPIRNNTGFRLVTVFENSSGIGDGCVFFGVGPTGFPASFYCVGVNWQ